MLVVVAEPYLLPHRDLLISKSPPDTEFCWTGSDVSGADVYIGSVFTSAMGAAADRLRLVQVAGAGTNGVDISALPPDAVCANTFQHGPSIGEYVVAALVMLARRIPEQDRALRSGRCHEFRVAPPARTACPRSCHLASAGRGSRRATGQHPKGSSPDG